MILKIFDKKTGLEKNFKNIKTFDKVLIKCDNCKKEIIKNFIKNRENITKLCRSCNYKKTSINRYGIDNISKLASTKKKIKETCLERYGVYSANKLENKINKTKETFIKNYGVDHPSKSLQIKEKIKSTSIVRYGVDSPNKSNIIKAKKKETFIKNYGETTNLKTEDFKKYYKEKMLSLYGVDHPSRSEILKNKSKKTCFDRWGTDSFSKTDKFKKMMFDKKEEINKKIFETKKQNGSLNASKGEIKLGEYLKQICKDFEHSKSIGFYTMDWFSKKLNIVVEFDGDYWHAGIHKLLNEDDLNNQQKKNFYNDKNKNKYLLNNGHKFIRILESEFYKHLTLGDVKKWLKKLLN
jgi:very-short-patch-repair endonuclease